jgi:citrate lyase subunit beta/citryl-CoA lyase
MFRADKEGVSMMVRPRRSVLYMPGANERALEKAKAIAADSLILDLEDSVAPDAKPQARANVAAAVKSKAYGKRELIIRINGLDTPWGVDDLKAAAEAGPDAVLVPKVARPGDIVNVARIFGAMGGPDETRMWAMMETPMAIFNVREIASVHQVARLACFVLGTNDLLKESRALATGGRFAILPWLSMTLLAARAYGLDVIDGVYNDFKDEAGFRAECEQGRTLGMDGKTLIHPGQVDTCNAMFSPSPTDVEWSRKIMTAFDLPENAKKGVITVEGRMVERLHLAMAKRVVAIAEATAA